MWLLLNYWWYFQSITVYNKKGQNSLRRLFHLTRFYQQYQSKYTILTNIVATYLNKQPMKRQEIHKTREQCVSKGVWSNHALVISSVRRGNSDTLFHAVHDLFYIVYLHFTALLSTWNQHFSFVKVVTVAFPMNKNKIINFMKMEKTQNLLFYREPNLNL